MPKLANKKKQARKKPTEFLPVEIQGITSFRFQLASDCSGNWVAPNKVLASFFNLPVRAFHKKSFFINDLVHADYQLLLLQLLRGLKPRKHVEFDCPLKGKPSRWIKIKAKAEPNGAALMLSGFFVDITQQKKNEANIRDNQLKLGHILANSQEAVEIRDKEMKLVYCNHATRALLGYGALEDLRLGFHDYNHPDDQPKLDALLTNALKNPGIPIKTSFRRIHKQGHEVWVEGNITNLLHERSVQAIVSNFEDITERKKAELALEQERQLFIDGPTVVFSWKNQPGWPVEYVSPNVKTQFGVEAADLMSGKIPYANMVHPDDLARVAEEVRAHSEKGVVFFEQEYRLKHPVKGWRWIYDFTIITRNPLGEITHYQGTVLDRTEQKLAEEAIRREHELADSVINNLPGIFWIFNREGQIIRWNENLRTITGYQPNELTAMKSWQLFHSSQALHIRERIEKAFETVLPGIERTLVTRQGEEIPMYIQAWAMQYENHECIMAIAVDMSEQKKSKRALELSEARYRNLFNQSPVLIATHDLEGTILSVNDKAPKAFGLDSAQVIGKNLTYFLEPSEREKFWTGYLQPLLKNNHQSGIYRVALPGKKIYLFYNSYKQADENGVPYIIGFAQDITALQIAERSLRDSEYFLSESQRVAGIGSYHYDIVKNNWRSSEVLNNILGIDTEQKKDFNLWVHLIHPYDRAEIQAYFQNEVLEKRNPFNKEYRIVRPKDGEERWVWGQGKLIINEEGTPTGLRGVIQDITERKHAELSLRESDRRLALTTSSAGIGVWDWDIETGERFWDDRCLILFGITREEFTNNPALWLDLLHPEDKAQTLQHEAHALTTANSFKSQYRVLHKDGQIRHIQDFAQILRNNDGKAIKMVGVSWDVTETKLMEESLREEEIRFRVMADAAPVLIWMTDASGRMVYVNQKWLDFTGRPQEMELDFGWKSIIHPDDTSLIPNCPSDSSQRKPFSFVFRMLRADGQYRWMMASAEPRKPGQGGFLGYIGTCTDITDQKEKDEKLLEANKKISELQLIALRAAMNPHFIFNALNAIQFYITQNDRANALSYLSKFSKLVRGILNSSVTKTIRLSSELELLRYYIEIEQARFENRFDFSIKVGREVDAETVEIPSLLIQPFVENAILHGLYNKEDKGILVVEINATNEYLFIMIEDNGIGRQAAGLLKEKNFPMHKSIGLKITTDRLQLHNAMLLEPPTITDLFENGAPSGTRVQINVRI